MSANVIGGAIGTAVGIGSVAFVSTRPRPDTPAAVGAIDSNEAGSVALPLLTAGLIGAAFSAVLFGGGRGRDAMRPALGFAALGLVGGTTAATVGAALIDASRS